jgi:hypothetical protein
MHWEKGLRLRSAPRHDCRGRKRRLRKTAFLSHFYIKTIILPRQARDKHRENSKKDAVFRTGLCGRYRAGEHPAGDGCTERK